MNIKELEERLFEEGCNAGLYSVGSVNGASDAFCLTQDDGKWRVYYTERGQDHDPIFESESEVDACDFFFRYIMSIRHEHCVGFFRLETNAQDLVAKLEQLNIGSRQDKIPYGGWEDPRFRVFVFGKDIFNAKDLLGAVPVED